MPLIRRLFMILLIAALTLTTLPFNSTAAQSREADKLAAYMPANTDVFLSIRTDDAYLATLEALISRLAAKIPGVQLPESFLRKGLHDLFGAAFRLDFEKEVRSWLGSRVAIGLSASRLMGRNVDQTTIFTFAAEVTDRAKAEAFITLILKDVPSVERLTMGDYTAFVVRINTPYYILVGDTALIFGSEAQVAVPLGKGEALTSLSRYIRAAGELPEAEYNLYAYLDMGTIFSTLKQSMGGMGGTGAGNPFDQPIIASLEAITIGGTLLSDGKTLALDFAQTYDLDIGKRTGLVLPYTTPVQTSFLKHIPQDAGMLIQIADLNQLYEAALALLESQLPPDQRERMMRQLTDSVREATGLDLATDIMGWMQKDTAIFLSYDSTAPNMLLQGVKQEPVSLKALNVGIVIDTSADPEKAKNMAKVIGDLLVKASDRPAPNSPVTVSREQINGAIPAVTLTFTAPTLAEPVELLIAANDQVFVVGTRKAVEGVFSGVPGLDGSATYAAAAKVMVANPTQVLYIGENGWDALSLITTTYASAFLSFSIPPMTPFPPMSTTPQPTPNYEATRTARQAEAAAQVEQLYGIVRGVFGEFTHATISGTYSKEGVSLSRFTLTLK
ncbi:MAG TPA: DUF3352 domain-containing protein [Aggregatilineales bacterium]|nr:DUF3352 domain-containing protein [Anaerolineales bacterium]HRE48352.1 DUF3352 domain-containing protein [Aggregatilineales bacterium]